MEQLGHWMKEGEVDSIVVLTPHGLSIQGHFTVVNTSYMSGEMSERTLAAMSNETRDEPGNTVSMTRTVDRELAKSIIGAAEAASLPVVSANFATSEGQFSNLPLDWGAMIPLYFMPDVPVVVVSPSRQLSFEDHLRFGEALADAVRTSGKRVGLIASCDWSHALNPNGPYGYHEDAVELDKQVVEYLTSNNIEAMMQFSGEFIRNAKPDGIWQSLILAGAIPTEERNSTFLSYEAPTYFGILCVGYR
jgi:aromatic ring-opening dioxygenase LigB subunit